METENLKKFIDGIVEGAYQARIFAKEAVHEVLLVAEVIKNKLDEADKLANTNTELQVKVEILEAENKLLRDKFAVTDTDIESIKNENVINGIDVNDAQDISDHTQKNGKLKIEK